MNLHRTAGPLAQEPGTVFAFRTAPLFAESLQDTGRYGAVVILSRNTDIVALGVLDSVWTSLPTIDDVRGRELLRRNRFFFKNQIAAFACEVNDEPSLKEFTKIGHVPLTTEQLRLGERYLDDRHLGNSYGSPNGASNDVEGEWRWPHDRETLLREHEQQEQRRERERVAVQERYEHRLKGLSWEQLLSETPFLRWEPSPPFPPAEFRDAAAERVHEACRLLQALGAKPRKAVARKILKDLVLWFNEADERAGLVIETEEREDIWLVLEELAHVARQPLLLQEVDAWRQW